MPQCPVDGLLNCYCWGVTFRELPSNGTFHSRLWQNSALHNHRTSWHSKGSRKLSSATPEMRTGSPLCQKTIIYLTWLWLKRQSNCWFLHQCGNPTMNSWLFIRPIFCSMRIVCEMGFASEPVRLDHQRPNPTNHHPQKITTWFIRPSEVWFAHVSPK